PFKWWCSLGFQSTLASPLLLDEVVAGLGNIFGELFGLYGKRFSNVELAGSGVQLPGGSPAICALNGLTAARPTALHASTILKPGPSPGTSDGVVTAAVLITD